MFDFDVGKLLLIGVVALIFIPPKDLPNALRQLGRIIGQARRMAADFQNHFSEALREAELSQIKDDLHNLKQQASVEDAFGRVADMLEKPVESKPAAATSESAETAGRPASAQTVAAPTSEATPLPQPVPQPAPLPEPGPLSETPRLEPGRAP